MREKLLSMSVLRLRRYPLTFLGIVLALLVSAMPVGADVISIDPSDVPEVTLPPDEAQRLETLQKAEFPGIVSGTSPNGKFVLTRTAAADMTFLNVITGQTVAVSPEIFEYTRMTEYRWRNNRILTYVASDNADAYYRVQLHRRSGEMSTTPLDIPGYPLSLSNGADKVLVGRLIETAGHALKKRVQTQLPASPIKRVTLPNRFSRPGPAKFAYEDRLTVPVTTAEIALLIYNLSTGEETPLLEVPLDTALFAGSWSRGDRRYAMIRGKSGDYSRSGRVDEDSPQVQDALGQLSPKDNPYFTSNTLDLFDLGSNKVTHREMHPDEDDGAVFRDVEWDPSGMIFVAQMWTAGTPEGRPHPTYTYPNGSKYRFYWRNGQMISSLDRPEVEALYGMVRMISPFEALIHAPHEMDFKVFRYHLLTDALTPLSTPPGSVYQMKISPRRREIVYNFSSYQQPYEVFRLRLNRDTPKQITHYNDQVRDLNKVRADQVQFSLSNGAERKGYLIQSADAAFPPENVPIVVWQQGGPIAPMTQEWGSIVEIPFNLLPNFGVAVLVVPLPGRDGFGREFLDGLADSRNFGQVDIDEQVEIMDQLVHWNFTSWGLTGITGCSYGGYFASQSVSSHSGVYAAANPQCSLLDLFSEWNMGWPSLIAYLMGRTPDDEEEYHHDSPLSNAEFVDTPTLIFAGTEDFLPSDLSGEFHDRISAAGTPADYYEFIGEPHGLYQATSQFVAGQAQLEWFRNYLQP